ncbi:hypothetical protein LPMP_311310 [Leishmania panamensis]|uniref:Uncharacterized protein n=1 Tax=Leishmania panamensis TaxID=5679 RepID=A0A088RXS9_LEIPA|nr:hypothetical protein LPMP_311310 [Leishmania panamensis]AIO00721.1 hypothetical protein LPMP_311310 [Leishmania panamensis]
MRPETQSGWGGYTDSAETRIHLGSSGADLYTGSSQSVSQPYTRSQSPDTGSACWNLQSSIGTYGQGHARRGTAVDVSPPPRLPLSLPLNGVGLGVGPRRGYAGHEYEGSYDNEYEEDADRGSSEDEYEWEGNEECDNGKYAYEHHHNDDSEASEGSSARNGAATSGMFSQGARDLGLDFEASRAPQTADAQPTCGFGFPAAKLARLNVLGQGSTRFALCAAAAAAAASATKAAPVTTSTFRRCTPVARVAYSVGYDPAAGESSEDLPSASEPRDEGVVVSLAAAEAANSFEQTSFPFTAANIFNTATQGSPDMTMAARPIHNNMRDTPPKPSADACHTSTASIARSVVASRAAVKRSDHSCSALTSVAQTSGSPPAHGDAKKSAKEPLQSTPDHRRESMSSSPLSPQRPTIGAKDDMYGHSSNDDASSTGSASTAISPVLAVGKGDDARGCGNVGGSELPALTEPTKSPDAAHVVPSPMMGSATFISGKPNLLRVSGLSRFVADFLARWKYSMTEVDTANSACEREGYARSPSNRVVLPALGISSPAVAPLLERESPLVGLRSREKMEEVDAAVKDLAAMEQRGMQSSPAKSDAPPVYAPNVLLNISVTTVFNYSEAEKLWLSRGQPSTPPARATQRLTSVTGSAVPPSTARALDRVLRPPSAPSVKVSLYCRPLLVQLSNPSLHACVLCAAGNSALVRVALTLLYCVPRSLVLTLPWVLIRFTVALVVLVAALVVMDAAWCRWPNLSVYTAEFQVNATMMILSVREWLLSSLGADSG